MAYIEDMDKNDIAHHIADMPSDEPVQLTEKVTIDHINSQEMTAGSAMNTPGNTPGGAPEPRSIDSQTYYSQCERV